MKNKARLIAFYLPQYHPIPENNEWWGPGFTEWTNVGKAKALFCGHDQPKVPADLGYYDLRVSEARKAQADLAKEYGIEAFCYWHYWFGNGKRLLERPFNEVLSSNEPDFPFCLAWANETWKGFAHGLNNRNTLIEQQYPGVEDYIAHFNELLPAFQDKRYLKVDNKPVFLIYKPFQHPEMKMFISLWQKMALENGLDGIYFIGHSYDSFERQDLLDLGFDAVNLVRMYDYKKYKSFAIRQQLSKLRKILFHVPRIVSYKFVSRYFTGEEDRELTTIPTIIPNWDHTPRSGRNGLVFHNSTPEYFDIHVKDVLDKVKEKPEEKKLVFVKSWNEWAEGNYLEPDLRYGRRYLEVVRENIVESD